MIWTQYVHGWTQLARKLEVPVSRVVDNAPALPRMQVLVYALMDLRVLREYMLVLVENGNMAAAETLLFDVLTCWPCFPDPDLLCTAALAAGTPLPSRAPLSQREDTVDDLIATVLWAWHTQSEMLPAIAVWERAMSLGMCVLQCACLSV
jgi:hypothetical protein